MDRDRAKTADEYVRKAQAVAANGTTRERAYIEALSKRVLERSERGPETGPGRLQRRDGGAGQAIPGQRHAVLFDRIAAEVLQLPGDTAEARCDSARAHAPAGVLELFEERLPAMAEELAAGRAGVDAGIGLYHMVLEGIVLAAGQHALLADLEDGALPGVCAGVERVERDERWHIGFGLRCLIDAQPSAERVDEMLAAAEEAAGAWGDAVPADIREAIVPACRRRLSVAKLLDPRATAI